MTSACDSIRSSRDEEDSWVAKPGLGTSIAGDFDIAGFATGPLRLVTSPSEAEGLAGLVLVES
jgi:hypothetical protein